jgi:inosine-uridine nucleoside N-ribohydrolase
MYKVVWDMDPGIDDALALILALKSPEVQILGITTVAGNAPVEMTSANARRVLEYLDADNIPVAMGAANPLNQPLEDALSYHGPDGLGNCGLPPPKLPLYPAKAWDLLARLVLDVPGEVTLIATGPLTNVAYAFELHPELPGLLARLVVMGGAYGLTPYGKGNRTPYAEFNIWQDPEAAHIVFNSGANVFAVGLDVTMDPAACLTSQHLRQIKTRHTPTAHLVAQLVEYEVKHHGCCRMHDPLALAVLLDASLLDFTLAKVEIVEGNRWDRGVTRVLPSESCHLSANSSQLIHVASAVDGPRFLKLFLSRILEE